MTQWKAFLLILGAILYLLVPWDLDFVPVVGRLDDLLLLSLALYYYWRKKKAAVADRGGDRRKRAERGDGGEERPFEETSDPYRVLDVERGDSEAAIKKAYRDLLGKYHPDRVQHLGEEFREMAARKAKIINRAFETIKRERNFS